MIGRPRSVDDDQIFDAVGAVVSEQGPNGLTLASIAERVGLTAPALTQRFGSKRALLLGFAERSARSTVAVFERARDRATDAATAIVDGLVDLVRPIDSRTALANNLAMLHLDLVDPELGAHARAQSRAFRAELVALIGDGVRDASLHDVDPATLADTLATVYNGALITWAIDGDGRLDEWLRTRLERALEPFRA